MSFVTFIGFVKTDQNRDQTQPSIQNKGRTRSERNITSHTTTRDPRDATSTITWHYYDSNPDGRTRSSSNTSAQSKKIVATHKPSGRNAARTQASSTTTTTTSSDKTDGKAKKFIFVHEDGFGGSQDDINDPSCSSSSLTTPQEKTDRRARKIILGDEGVTNSPSLEFPVSEFGVECPFARPPVPPSTLQPEIFNTLDQPVSNDSEWLDKLFSHSILDQSDEVFNKYLSIPNDHSKANAGLDRAETPSNDRGIVGQKRGLEQEDGPSSKRQKSGSEEVS